jgi:hypothetical protein
MLSKIKTKTKCVIFLTIALLLANQAYTQKRYVLNCDKILLSRSHKIALNEVGTVEKSNKNDGDVEKYARLFGLGTGTQYCAAGQYYAF